MHWESLGEKPKFELGSPDYEAGLLSSGLLCPFVRKGTWPPEDDIGSNQAPAECRETCSLEVTVPFPRDNKIKSMWVMLFSAIPKK
jgi:hypothetical protein